MGNTDGAGLHDHIRPGWMRQNNVRGLLMDNRRFPCYDFFKLQRINQRKRWQNMTRKKLFMTVQAVLCAVIAALLAAGALSLYLDGAAKQAEGDLFYYMFTRERAGAKLLPVLPLLFCAVGLTIAGVILGIRDENADKPVKDEKLLRNLGSVRERAVHQQADQKTLTLRTAVLVIALVLIVIGIINGGLEDVLAKGAAICTECVGLG